MIEIISLGHSCGVATLLEQWGLLSTDTMLSNMISKDLESVIKFITSKGEKLFAEENVQWMKYKNDRCWWAYDTYYKFLSIYEVPINLSGAERITKLQNVKNFAASIFFLKLLSENLLVIRNNQSEESLEAIVQLYDAISKFRDEKPFTLCILQNKEFPKYNIPGLEIYNTEKAHYDEKGKYWTMGKSWKLALKSIILKIKQHNPSIKIPKSYETDEKVWLPGGIVEWKEFWTQQENGDLGRAFDQISLNFSFKLP